MSLRNRLVPLTLLLALAACGTEANPNPPVDNSPKVTISGVTPADALVVGAQATVLGKGFGDASKASITLDTATITTFLAGSDDGHLVFQVPEIAGLPGAGKSVALKVTSTLGTATTNVTVKPAAPVLPEGRLFVRFQRAPAVRPPGPGSEFDLTFEIRAITTADETYTVMAAATGGWSAATRDAAGEPASTIQIPKSDAPDGSTQTFRVHVAIPADAAEDASAQLMVFVASQKNPHLSGFTGLVTMRVGEWPEPSYLPLACVGTNDSFGEGFIQTAPGTPAQLTFEVDLPDAATYHRVFTVEGDPEAKWTIGGDTADFTSTAAGTSQFHVSVTPSAGAPDAVLHVSVVSADDEAAAGEVVLPIRVAR